MPPKPAATNGATVLFVDDEPDILDSLKALLEASIPKLHVKTAESGAMGLQILKAERVDLIISDYKMPGMDGLEFLKRAQQMKPQVPRILLTAFPKLELALQAINEVDVDKFLTKPVQPDQIVEVVRSRLPRGSN